MHDVATTNKDFMGNVCLHAVVTVSLKEHSTDQTNNKAQNQAAEPDAVFTSHIVSPFQI